MGDTRTTDVISTAIRPARVAILVPSPLAGWEQLMSDLAAYVSELWAGRWNAIPIPVSSDSRIRPPFDALLAAFDPDFVVKFEPDLASMNNVGEMQGEVDRLREEIRGSGVSDPESSFADLLEQMPLSWVHFSEVELISEQILLDAGPFNTPAEWPWVDTCSNADSQPTWPLTIWSAYARAVADWTAVTDPVCGVNDDLLRSVVAWSTGTWGAKAGELLAAAGVSVEPTDILLNEAHESIGFMFGMQKYSRLDRFHAFNQALGNSVAATVPAAVTMLDAAAYFSSSRGSTASPIVVIGDEELDFLLWVCLSRLRNRVAFLPKRLVDSDGRRAASADARGAYARALLSAIDDDSDEVHITSATLDGRQLGTVKGQLRRIELTFSGESVVDKFRTVLGASIAELAREPLVVWERDPFQSSIAIALDDSGKSFARVSLPVPQSSRSRELGDKRWITEIEIQGRHLPMSPRAAESAFVSDQLSDDFARVSSGGSLAVWHPYFAVWSGASMTQTWNTEFRSVPASVDLLRTMVGPSFDVRLHDKGRYAAYLVERVGLTQLNAMIESFEFGQLMATVISGSGGRSGRTVALDDAQQISEQWTSWLLASGLATIVHRVKCGICSHAADVGLHDLADSAACQRCGGSLTLASLSADPHFRRQRLQLNEVLGLFLEHRSDAVLTAFSLATSEERYPEYMPEVELQREGSDDVIQLDVVGLGSGLLFVGEVKTGERFGTRKQRRRWSAELQQLASDLLPVSLVPVWGWTTHFSELERQDLARRGTSPRFVQLPSRPWH